MPFARSPAPPTNLLSRVARIESGSGVAGQVAGPVCGVYMQTTQGGGARGERGEGAGSERERQHQSGSVVPADSGVKEMCARVVMCMNLP